MCHVILLRARRIGKVQIDSLERLEQVIPTWQNPPDPLLRNNNKTGEPKRRYGPPVIVPVRIARRVKLSRGLLVNTKTDMTAP